MSEIRDDRVERSETSSRRGSERGTLSAATRKTPIRVVATYTILVSGCVIVVGPYVWEALTTVKTVGEAIRVPPKILPDNPQWGNYSDVTTSVPFARQFVNTVIVAVARTIGLLFVCSLAAYAFARLSFPLKRTLFATFLAVLMVPYQLFIIPQFKIMIYLDLLNSLPALILPGLFNVFGVFLLRQFFMKLPRELDDAAEMDGCNPFQRYLYIGLPLAKPGILALGVLSLVYSWNDLLWPLIVNTDPEKMTLAPGLASLQDQYISNYPVIMAGALMASVPMVVLFAVLQRQFIQGIATTGVRG